MKVPVILFLLLSSLLFGICNYAHADSGVQKNISFPGAAFEKTIYGKNFNHSLLLSCNVELDQENDYLVLVEDEDDQENFTRKYLLSSKCFVSFCHAFILDQVESKLTDAFSSYKHPLYSGSGKYLVQRALRI